MKKEFKKFFIKNLKDLFKFRSLNFIIAFSFTIIMAISFIITFFIIINKSNETNKQNMGSVSLKITQQLGSIINSYINDLINVSDDILYQLFLDNKLQETISIEALKSISSLRSDIKTTILLDKSGNIVEKDVNEVVKNNLDFSKKISFILPLTNKNTIFFSEPHVQNIFYNNYPWVITLSRNTSFYNSDNNENYVLMMDIDLNSFGQRINKLAVGNSMYSYLIDKYGDVIFHPNEQYIYWGAEKEDTSFALKSPDGSYITEKDGKQISITIQTIPITNWKIVSVGLLENILVPQQEIINFFITTIITCILLMIIISLITSILISHPINKLKQNMILVEQGDFDIEVNVRGNIEVEQLSASFNNMVAQIKKLINDIVREHEEKRKSELLALQTQIQPHFLYNTLESIIWMAEKGENESVIKMISALAKLFRLSLGKGKDIISVRDEILHIENYLEIQKMRYSDKIDYQINATKESLECFMLNLILQPIVENSIYHGFKEINEKGTIKIDLWIEQDKLLLEIADNGVGMSIETIEKIFKKEFISTNGSGLGVKTVDERIKLYYGNQYGLKINSKIDEGTCVLITLPKLME